MEKFGLVLACLAFACHSRRVQLNLAPGAVGAPRVLSPIRTQPRSSPIVAQWWDTSPGSAKATSTPKTGWEMEAISPDGRLVKRIEGQTRKTWSFDDLSRDRVSVAVGSEGRPVHSDIDLWIGPNYTPFKLNAYSEDGRLRPIQVLVGTRSKSANIDIVNTGPSDFPIKAAASYATPAMAAISQRPKGEICQGSAIRSYAIDPSTEQLEVCLRTDGKQLNAKIELLNSPNNPKQTYQVFTNNGELNSLCMCFNTPDTMTTVRVRSSATVEFPLYINLNEITADSRSMEVPVVDELDVPVVDELDAPETSQEQVEDELDTLEIIEELEDVAVDDSENVDEENDEKDDEEDDA